MKVKKTHFFYIIVTYIEPDQVEIYLNKLKSTIDEYRESEKLQDLLDFNFKVKNLTDLENLEGFKI